MQPLFFLYVFRHLHPFRVIVKMAVADVQQVLFMIGRFVLVALLLVTAFLAVADVRRIRITSMCRSCRRRGSIQRGG